VGCVAPERIGRCVEDDLGAAHDADFRGRQRLAASCIGNGASDVGIRRADWVSRANAWQACEKGRGKN
jgi:hypothetical protein